MIQIPSNQIESSTLLTMQGDISSKEISQPEVSFVYRLQALACRLMTQLAQFSEQSRGRSEVLKKDYGKNSECAAKLQEKRGNSTFAFAVAGAVASIGASAISQIGKTSGEGVSQAMNLISQSLPVAETVYVSRIDANHARKSSEATLGNTELGNEGSKASEGQNLSQKMDDLLQALRQTLQAATRY